MADKTLMSGTPSTSSTIHGFRIYFYFTYTKTSAGKTKVSWTAKTGYKEANSNYPATSTLARASYSLSFSSVSNGTISNKTGTSYDSGAGESNYKKFKNNVTLDSGSLVFNHDYDGAGGSFKVSANVGIGGYDCDVSTTISLDDNPPESVTISNITTTITDEQNISFKYTNNIGSNLSKIRVSLKEMDSDKTTVLAWRDAVTGSISSGTYTFNFQSIVADLHNAMKTVNSKQFYLAIGRIFSDDSHYTTYHTITVNLVNHLPSLSVNVVDTNTKTTGLTGNNKKFILGYSNAAITITPSLKKSATQTSLKTTDGSKTVSGTSGTITGVISSTLTSTISDSRGNSTSIQTTLSTINYTAPTIKINKATINSSTSLTINYSATGFVGSFGSKNNTFTLYYRYKLEGGSYGSWTQLSSGTSLGSSFNLTVSNAYVNQYVQLKLNDSLASVTSNELFHSTGIEPVLKVKNASSTIYTLGAIQGKTAGTGVYELAQSAGYTGTKAQFSKQLLNPPAFPIGTIYTTFNTTSPSELFGGTWTQISNKFIMSAGSTYAAGGSGGAATVTITTDTMPKHKHETPYRTSSGSGTKKVRYIERKRYDSYQYMTYTGGGKAHNNMPPYIVANVWEKTGY